MDTNHYRIRGIRLDKSNLTIDGKPLADLAVFALTDGITIGESKPITVFQAAPGRSGSWDMTLDDIHGYPAMERREITIEAAATGDPMEITEAKALIGGFNGRSIRMGGLTDLGEFHGRLSVGAWQDRHDADGTLKWSACTLSLDAEPYAHGPTQRINLPVGDDFTEALILGNRPAWPTLHQQVHENTGSVTPVTATHTFTADGRTIWAIAQHAGGKPDEAAHELTIDCEHRQALWKGKAATVPIDHDYPSMKPGRILLRASIWPDTNVARYSQYLTYTPRWLI